MEREQMTELPMLAGIAGVIHWVEELAALLSGPILTAGLGIALINLLTAGKLLATAPVMLFIWAASQSVGLDAQLVGSSAKLGAAIRRRAPLAIIGYVLLVGALGYVAYLASDVFAMQQADGITTAQALARLGMDSATWLIQRSALAVVLVILSGLLRYVAPAKAQASIEDERARLARELELEPLRQRLRAQQVGGWRAVAQTALQGADRALNAAPAEDDVTAADARQRALAAAQEDAQTASATMPDTSAVRHAPENAPDEPPDGDGGGIPHARPAAVSAPMPPAPTPFGDAKQRRERRKPKPAAIRKRDKAALAALERERQARAWALLEEANGAITPNALARALGCRWQTAFALIDAWHQQRENQAG